MSILQRRFALIRRYVLGVLLLVPLFLAQGAPPQAAMVQPNGSGSATGVLGLSASARTSDIEPGPGTPSPASPSGDLLSNPLPSVHATDGAMTDAGRPLIHMHPPGPSAHFLIPIDLEEFGGRSRH